MKSLTSYKTNNNAIHSTNKITNLDYFRYEKRVVLSSLTTNTVKNKKINLKNKCKYKRKLKLSDMDMGISPDFGIFKDFYYKDKESLSNFQEKTDEYFNTKFY